ncbi:MAG: T9SS type A sorting domain-containing protein [Chlorobi bacterium]|nr:T9SS type A sorting domain-containing protein [Chlorobiota bacterium]
MAFCYGFDDFDGLLFKSTDNGDTWEKTVVFESSIDPFDVPEDSDIIPCGDGTCAIALDSQGKAHITFSRKLMYYESGSYFCHPTGTDGVIYSNESMAPLDTTIISSYTNQYLIDGGYLAGYMLPDENGSYEILPDQMSYGNQSMTSFSQLAIDDNDNLFLSYASVAPGFDNSVNNYRHILVNVSYNGGSLWIGPEDLNTDLQYLFSECVYPAISPVVNDKIHIIFQEDGAPGIFEWLENHEAHENTITHLEYDKFYFTDVKNAVMNTETFELSQNYPNPAVNTTYFSIQLGTASEVKTELRNSIGQIVMKDNLGIVKQGKTNLSMGVSEMTSGIYYYTIFANDQKQTRILIVQ